MKSTDTLGELQTLPIPDTLDEAVGRMETFFEQQRAQSGGKDLSKTELYDRFLDRLGVQHESQIGL